MLDSVEEFGDHIQLQILSVFPGFILQQIYNCLAIRQVVPRGVGKMDLVWTYFGFEDDTPPATAQLGLQMIHSTPAGRTSPAQPSPAQEKVAPNPEHTRVRAEDKRYHTEGREKRHSIGHGTHPFVGCSAAFPER